MSDVIDLDAAVGHDAPARRYIPRHSLLNKIKAGCGPSGCFRFRPCGRGSTSSADLTALWQIWPAGRRAENQQRRLGVLAHIVSLAFIGAGIALAEAIGGLTSRLRRNRPAGQR